MEILLTEEQIKKRIKELGEIISSDYKDKFPIFVGILKGAFVFLSDLLRNVKIDCEVDFMGTTSYNDSTHSSGIVRITYDLTLDIENRHVIIVEDVLDTGLTLEYICKTLSLRKPLSLRTCVLLKKDMPRKVSIEPDYIGFVIPNKFVIGYGLDYAGKYRNLPYIGVIDKKKS